MKLELSDYLEIQRFLQESLDGVSWDEIGEVFKHRLDPQQAVNAAGMLLFCGFAVGMEYPKIDGGFSIMPSKIRGIEDGIDRLRELQAVLENRGTKSFRKGWDIEDSERILSILAII